LARGGKAKREVDIAGLVRILSQQPVGHAFIEMVGAMPSQGVSSVFAFGKAYGILLGSLGALGVPYTPVSPRVWKKILGVPAEKDGALARASQLLPTFADQWPLKRHHGRAEAALLAEFGLRQFQNIVSGGEKAA